MDAKSIIYTLKKFQIMAKTVFIQLDMEVLSKIRLDFLMD